MGLLDSINLDDPKINALMGLGQGLLASGGPSAAPVSVGQGLAAGLSGMQQAFQAAKIAKLRDLQAQSMALDVKEKERKFSDLDALRNIELDYYSRNGVPGSQGAIAVPGAAGVQAVMQNSPSEDLGGFGGQFKPQMSVPQTSVATPVVNPVQTNTVANGVTAKSDKWQQYAGLADYVRSKGLGDLAEKYDSLAEKFRPKLKDEQVRADPKTGKPVLVRNYEDGSTEVSPYAPVDKIEYQDIGGKLLARSGLTGNLTGGYIGKTQSPDSIASNAITLRGQNLQYGISPEGQSALEAEAQGIARGALPPPTGMAATRPQTAALMKRVMEINPNYDYTDVTAKKKAASDFTSGSLGNQMRSFYTAGNHLYHLGNMIDALDNGNIQVVNRAKNFYQEQTGGVAPTNFNAVREIVGKEVMKALLPGGGSQSERDDITKTLNNAKSADQLKDVVTQFRILMNAQYENLLEQRRAAGLRDDTLPNYGGNSKSKSVVATGTYGGRKVNKLSDGSVVYAD